MTSDLSGSAIANEGRLGGCTAVVTRERPGELARLLAAEGAGVVHVPLIEVDDPVPADREKLRLALADEPEWIAVTSAAAVDAIAEHVRTHPRVRVAVVGTATARQLAELVGRAADLIPGRQMAEALAAEFNASQEAPARVLVAQADRAADVLLDELVAAGHDVTAVTAYRTRLRHPTGDEQRTVQTADAVLFASGSAALSWADVFGTDVVTRLPPIVAAIGPTTADAARNSGLKVTHVAADHSLAGLIEVVVEAWNDTRVTRPS